MQTDVVGSVALVLQFAADSILYKMKDMKDKEVVEIPMENVPNYLRKIAREMPELGSEAVLKLGGMALTEKRHSMLFTALIISAHKLNGGFDIELDEVADMIYITKDKNMPPIQIHGIPLH